MFPRISLLLFRVGTAAMIASLAVTLYADDAKKPAIDPMGASLPDDALMRLGSLRWRHGEAITFIAYPPNGKTLITATDDATLIIWDRETGNAIRRLTAPIAGGVVRANFYTQGLTRAAMSGDGKLLAVVLPNNMVQLWEVETGKAVRQIKGLINGATALSFSPSGKILAMRGSNGFTHLFDTETGNELRNLANRVGFAGSNGSGIAFSHDGNTIAVADLEVNNQKVIAFLTFFETATGKETRRIELPTSGVTGLVFSPDGKLFAHNVSNKIFIRDAGTGQEIRQFVSNFGATLLVFAPDSQSLAIKSRDQTIRLYDPANGNLIRTFGELPPVLGINGGFINYNNTSATDVVFSPDGRTLVLGGRQTPRFFEVATGKEQPIPGGGHRGAVSAVVVTPDGKSMLSRGADNFIRVWNVAGGAELSQFAEPAGTSSVAFSPDARLVALGNADGAIRFLDVADGKVQSQLKGHQGSVAALAFSPDGKTFASRGSYDGIIRVFDVATSAELKQITWQTINAGNAGAVIVRSTTGIAGGHPLLFSPDGKTLVTYVAPEQFYVQGQQQQQPGSNCIRSWNVASGKERTQIEIPAGRTINQLVFSPDGRLLISENVDKTVSIWETASGQERNRLGEPVALPATTSSTAFFVINGVIRSGQATKPAGATIATSLDGSLIASPGANHSVRVWDTSLGKEVGTFKGHNGGIASLAFAPDGKTLCSGSNDTTILVWDLARLKREPRPQIAELQLKEFDALWADLVSNNAVAAGKAVHKLIAANSSAAFLKLRMHPATPIDPAKIDQWVHDLDSSTFAKRTVAMSQLDKLGELAIPALQKVLAGKYSLETRRRVEPLLEKLTAGSFSAEQIRAIRAIEVLDKLGTPEAKQLLEQLASGAAGALTTRQAQAALDRHAAAPRVP